MKRNNIMVRWKKLVKGGITLAEYMVMMGVTSAGAIGVMDVVTFAEFNAADQQAYCIENPSDTANCASGELE